MKIIALMGPPGSGKTTLMRRILRDGEWEFRPKDHKLIPYYINKATKTAILGIYDDGEVFAGTDRMSMAAQPEAVKFLEQAANYGVENVIFEGDRLCTQSFLESCVSKYDTTIVFLNTDQSTREARFVERGSNQNEQFLRSRDTKIANIRNSFALMFNITEMPHYNSEDMAAVHTFIEKKLQW